MGSIRRGRRIGFWPMYSSHHAKSGTLDLWKLICIELISTDEKVKKRRREFHLNFIERLMRCV